MMSYAILGGCNKRTLGACAVAVIRWRPAPLLLPHIMAIMADGAVSMTDYYPAILRAVAALETNTFEGRLAIYNEARAALVEQLDKRPFIKKEVDRERLMLEEAISRIETETANKQTI